MSKLVIHVGYPKTATSTIQNKFFYPLHQKGEINFLGKACLGDVNYNPSSDLVMSTVYNKGKFKEFYLSKNIWNVVSNEDFVVSFFNIDNRKFLPESSSLKTPYNLKAALDSMEHSPDDVKIIVVLRRQCDLIYSSYVEGQRWYFRHESSLNTLDKFLTQGIKKKKNGIFMMYYFYDVLNEYAKCFGKENIHILLYEDLHFDNQYFVSELSSLLDVNEDTLKQALLYSDNSKEKSLTGYKTSGLTWLDILLGLVAKYYPVRFFFNVVKRSKLLWLCVQKIKPSLDKNKGISGKVIPYLNNEMKERIFLLFENNNKKLAKEFSLDSRKMKKYGYFR